VRTRSTAWALALGALLVLVGASATLAHEGTGEEEVVVEPASITAGDSVVLAGSGLEPDDERVLVLAGADLVVELGTVATDAEGMFQIELAIPSHLPSGTYELRAIGDETLTAALAVTAADVADAPAADPATESVVARERGPLELGAVIAATAIAALVGGLLVWRADRLHRGARA